MRKILLSATALLALGACTAPRLEFPQLATNWLQNLGTRQSAYDVGREHLYAGRVGKALEAFRMDWVQNGDSVRTLNGIAICYDLLGRREIADDYFERARRLDPQSPITQHNLANADAREASVPKLAASDEAPSPPAVPVSKVERVNLTTWQVSASAPAAAAPMAAAPVAALSSAAASAPAASPSATAITPQTARLPAVGVRVLNGTGRPDMARRMAGFVTGQGVPVNGFANAGRYSHQSTHIAFAPGHREAAERLAAVLPVPAEMREEENLRGALELTLGADLLEFDRALFYRSI